MEVNCQLHGLASLTPGMSLGTHWVGGLMGPRARLNVEKCKFFIRPRLETDPSVVQAAAGRYTDLAIVPNNCWTENS
jgi:hypothetical protein